MTKLAREGSNLISRDTSLQQAANVLTSMSATPVNFSNGDSTVIFSVLMKGGTTGTTNFGQVVLFQRATFGTYPATSRLTAAGGSYGGPPEYLAANPDSNAGLQVTNVPDSIINVNGGFLYVTEVFTRHNLLTGIDRLSAAALPGAGAEDPLLDRIFLSSSGQRSYILHKGGTDMNRHTQRVSSEEGFVLFYMAVFLTLLLICVGLAVDTGRAYVVQAQLSKAVDGAALGAARMLNSGNPRQEAANIYRANFPDGWMGTTSSTSPSEAGFFTMTTDATTGVNVVNVRATAIVPTTFMRLANSTELQVNALGEATRRMVDLSLVMDVSSSIGWRWQYVRDAARHFVDAFDQNNDRVSLVFFGNGARVIDAMPPGRGFDKARVMADIPNTLPGGSTRWSRACIEDGTSCARCQTASSLACVSSCCSPTARRTAFLASTIPGAPGVVERPENVGLPGQRRRP